MPISLKAASGGGGLYRAAANQTFAGIGGIGGISVPLTTVTTPTNLLVLNGKFALRALYLSYIAGSTSDLTITLTIDGRQIVNNLVFPLGTSAGTFIIFNYTGSLAMGDALEVNTNLTLTVQRSNASQISVSANAIALV